MAVWALDLLSAFDLPAVLPISLRLSPDSGVLAFSILLTLVTGLVFGILPARQALDLDLLSTLKGEGARAGSAEGRLRRAFVTAQVGASLVLLVASGLFLRALQHAGEIETGFEAEGAYLTTVDLATEGYDSEEGAVFQDELLAYFSAQPWVESVSLSIDLPLDMGSYGTHVIPDGWESGSGLDVLRVEFNDVSAEYFETLQIPVLQGRVFRETDREETEPVAVVSRRFAREVWPGESALGKRVLWGTGGDDYLTVIGVVEDVQNQLLTEDPRPFLYRPLLQHYRSETNLVIRTDLEPVSARREIQAGFRGLEPNISLSPVIDLQRYTAVGILPQRVAGTLATVLGLLALFLSGMGVYGVMAQTVDRRTREVGIRVALGAEPGRVLRSVLGGAFRLALPGLVVGVVLAGGVSVLLRSLLLGISPMDPVALAGVMGAMAFMVLAGTLVPARRAAKVDPAEALRHE